MGTKGQHNNAFQPAPVQGFQLPGNLYPKPPRGLARSSGRGLFMGKVWSPGSGTKGYVPEEHPLSPPSLVLGRQCLFVECSAPASLMHGAFLLLLQRHGVLELLVALHTPWSCVHYRAGGVLSF